MEKKKKKQIYKDLYIKEKAVTFGLVTYVF